jgi:hypothetical protein
MEKIFKQNIFSWLIIIVSMAFALLKADVLPDTIPRFDLWGREYAFVNKPTSLRLNPVLAAASIIVLSVLFGSPRERATQKVNDLAFKMIRSMSFTSVCPDLKLNCSKEKYA